MQEGRNEAPSAPPQISKDSSGFGHRDGIRGRGSYLLIQAQNLCSWEIFPDHGYYALLYRVFLNSGFVFALLSLISLGVDSAYIPTHTDIRR